MPLNELAPAAKAARLSEESSHWYEFVPAGKWVPLYEEGGTFGLRDARKLHNEGRKVFPSVTTIFKELHKEIIVNYRLEQALWSAIRSPYDPAEAQEDWINRMISTGAGASRGAADLGTAIHNNCEAAIKGEDYEFAYAHYVEAVLAERARLALVSVGPEVCVGSKEIGYAGKVDDRCEGKIIVDIKSRKWRENVKKGPTYSTDLMQISAYGYAEWGSSFFTDGMGYIFVVSTVTPGRVQAVPFSGQQLKSAFDAFVGLCAVWRFNHNLDPRCT